MSRILKDGYQTRTTSYTPFLVRWIQRAALCGQTSAAIAKRFRCDAPFVEGICKVHGITLSGVERPDHVPGRTLATEQSTIAVRVSNEALTKFEREAQRRGTTAAGLASQVLNIVAADELFSATLDL